MRGITRFYTLTVRKDSCWRIGFLAYSKASSLRKQWRPKVAHGAPLLPLETQR